MSDDQNQAGQYQLASDGAPSPEAKPWRALKPDAQAFDRVEIDTVPRYKTSGLSGDEWRISGRIRLYRKGALIHEAFYRNVETACRFVDIEQAKAHDDGKAFFAGEGVLCDQEGCAAPATWRHTLKKRFCREQGHPFEPMNGEHRLFCDEHKTRGDCGFEDADSNYIVEVLSYD